MPRKYLTVREAAAKVGCTAQTIYNAIEGDSPALESERRHIAGRRVTAIPADAVREFIRRRRQAAQLKVDQLQKELAAAKLKLGRTP